MKQKLIYILGLEHSGSTILDLLLSSHSDVLGLGESVFVLQKKQTSTENTKDFCSCSNKMAECDFWAGFKGKNYLDLLDYIKVKYGENIVISDSSKKLHFLKELLKSGIKNKVDLKIIFLVKDARAYASSMKGVFAKEGRRGNWYLRHFLNWHKSNKAMAKFLKKSNLDHLFVSYEALCQKSQETARKILGFVGLPEQELNLQGKGRHHLAYGNRAKLNNAGKLVYDGRWQKSKRAKFLIYLLPGAYFYNKHIR